MTDVPGPAGEQDLLNRAIAGEPLALERLLLDHHRPLRAAIEKRIPPTLAAVVSADDILQDCYSEAFRDIGKFRPEGPQALFRWLCTIADHRLLDAIRAHRSVKRGGGRAPIDARVPDGGSGVLALIEIVFAHEHTPSRSAAGHEAQSAMQSAIAALKPEYRDAIRLRYIEGRTVGETASLLNKTERSVHKLCSRGIQKLRESLGDASKYFSQ